MTKKDRDILLKDLCARLPYGIRYKGDGGWGINPYQHTTSLYAILNSEEPLVYLRPMSSMTKEEREDYRKAFDKDFAILGDSIDAPIAYEFSDGMIVRDKPLFNEIDWLNENMFDYRGLIPKGLALEAPEGIYK